MKTICFISYFIILNIAITFCSFGQAGSERIYIDAAIQRIKENNPNKTLDTVEVNKLIDISKKINYAEGETRLSFFKSIKMIQVGKAREAIALLQPLIERSGSRRLDSFKVLSCIKVSEAGIQLGDYFVSLQYLEKAAELNAASKEGLLAIALHNAHIWTVLSERNQPQGFQKALQYCLAAEKIARQLNNKHNLGTSLANAGMLYAYLYVWDSALIKLQEAVEIGKKHDLPHIAQLALLGIGEMYFNKGDYTKALAVLSESQQIIQFRSPDQYKEISLWQLATLIKLKNYAAAAHIVDTFKPGSIADERKLYLYKSELSYATGQYKESLDHYKKHIAIRDSIAGLSMQQELNYLDYKYKVIEKDKHILASKLLLNQKNNLLKKQRNWVLTSISAAIIIAMAAAIVYIRQSNKQKLKQKENELTKMQSYLEGEYKERERIAMDLHDSLGSLVSSIRLRFEMAMLEKFSDRDEINQIYTLISEAAVSVRDIAYNLKPSELEYADLKTAIRKYCETISMKTNLNIKVHAPEELRIGKAISAELLSVAKELLNNISKHSAAEEALVSLDQENDQITLKVADNGKGFVPDSAHLKGSGLLNLKHRVAKINGSIAIESEVGKGTSVVITVKSL